MHKHPVNIPVVEYYHLNGVNFTYCWRAGSTSITSLALNNNAEVLEEPPETCVLLLKHPIERFRSSHLVLPERADRITDDEGKQVRVVRQPPMNEYIDCFLDDTGGARSPHNFDQLGQHEAVKELIVYRLEGSSHLAGVELPWLNKSEFDKPLISDHPRYDELLAYYADDLDAWNDARPLTDLIYPAGVGV